MSCPEESIPHQSFLLPALGLSALHSLNLASGDKDVPIRD